jgi:hypothetical protein
MARERDYRPVARTCGAHVITALLTCVALALTAVSAGAQTPSSVVAGRNVNMVSGTTWPTGDPFLQRQNEPSIAASTRNPLHLLAGANDYRSVELPGLINDTETGDAWLGVFKSFDGGQRWQSTLLPGYQALGEKNSVLYGYAAGADPLVRAGTNGTFYYSGLVFDRGTETTPGKSAIFVSRFIDNNNLEAGDPIAYLGSAIVEKNKAGSGRFLDKPWLAVDIPRGGSTCNIPATATAPAQVIPAGAIYVAYTVITYSTTAPGGLTSQIFLSTSLNCGVTWSPSVRVSKLEDPINQGATIAINPIDGAIYVAWRRITPPNSTDGDALVIARSSNQGRKFSNPGVARRFPRGRKLGLSVERYFEHRKVFPTAVALDISEFDQGTSADALSFRTNAYPSMTFDGEGRLYLAWAERGYSQAQPGDLAGDARIMMTTTRDGTVFVPPRAVDEADQYGHQIMPTLTFANGRLMLAYYDLREDVSGVFGKYIDDATAIEVLQTDSTYRRHTIDLRATTAEPSDEPVFSPSTLVSEYAWGTPPGETGLPRQLQHNPPNLTLFQLGRVPFFGDYIDVAPAPAFVRASEGQWQYNTAAGTAPVFHSVWTDNRDVRPPSQRTADGKPDWTKYIPAGAEGYNACEAGTRNQNIYTARLTTGLIAGSPGNAKPLNTQFPRAFVVFAQNTTEQVKYFRFTILNQPPGGRASFLEYPVPPYAPDAPPPLNTIDVKVPRRSAVARTVYATSTDPKARIIVAVSEIAAVDGSPVPSGLQAAVVLNPDISNPDISNPDISNPDISNTEVHNPDISNPDISNPDISNPDISNPDISNPDISNPDISNPDISNPDISNPDISNPDISNPDISNPDISNPDISNPDISNGSITDVTWTVTNSGNTTTAFDVNLFFTSLTEVPDGIKLQLILYRVYKTPLANGCELKEQTHNVLVSNILNPDISNPDISNTPAQLAAAGAGGATQVSAPTEPDTPTLWIEPGGVAKITLRIVDKDRTDDKKLDPTEITPEIQAQAKNTDDLGDPSKEEPSAKPKPAPDVPLLTFTTQPVATPMGETMPEVVVSATLNSSGVGGVPVTMAFAYNPSGAELLGTTIVTSDATGLARFNNLHLTKDGTGFRFVASAGSTDAVPVMSAPFDSQGSSTVVTNTYDSGSGSLRQAILNANAHAGADVISFAIPGNGPFTIAPASRLPEITGPTIIDGRSQPGYVGTPIVELAGAAAGTGAYGLRITGGGSTVRGLVINRFSGVGIEISGGSSNVIAGNYVGLDLTGSIARPNGLGGIAVSTSTGNTIGGVVAAERNVLSGNTSAGLVLYAGADSNFVKGNYVGTNAAGTAAVPNSALGIFLSGGNNNTVGGTEAGARNIASGNGTIGIGVEHASTGNTVLGNYVGTNATGNAPVPNQFGIWLAYGAVNNTIGGTNAASGNLISGNAVDGILLRSATTTGNSILGNRIGTQPDGVAPLPNGAYGIRSDNVEGAPANTVIGLPIVGGGNIIAHNVAGQVLLESAINTRVISNSIVPPAGNVRPGIDLGAPGVLPNDPGDVDVGPNGLQNNPELAWADNAVQAGRTTVRFAFNSAPTTAYTLEFFDSPSCVGPLGPRAAEHIAVTSSVTTGADGNLVTALSVTPAIAIGRAVTATATGPEGTSEISACVSVINGTPLSFAVLNTNDSGPGSLRQAILDANAHPGLDNISFAIEGAVPFTIAPASALPTVSGPVIIDGTTQPGYVDRPVIELDGALAGTNVYGLNLAGSGSTVRGLAVNRFTSVGISMSGTGGHTIAGNYIGLGLDGSTDRGNGGGGINVSSDNNRIGGLTAMDRNIVSGNAYGGIQIYSGADGNTIIGNYCGTNAAGTSGVPNDNAGIFLAGGANNRVGDCDPANRNSNARNVLSGNGVSGIGVEYSSNNNWVCGNYIGTDPTGTTAVPNGIGVWFAYGAHDNRVGGPDPADRNIISGNTNEEVVFSGSAATTTGNRLVNNYIGTTPSGAAFVPAGRYGVIFDDFEGGATNSEVSGNLIAYLTDAGIVARAGQGNRFSGNSIRDITSGVAIDLYPVGPNPNDFGDGDAGPNGLQNNPELAWADNAVTPGVTTVHFTFNSTPNTAFTLQFFEAAACTPPSRLAARVASTISVVTDGSGNYSGNTAIGPALSVGAGVTATATGAEGTSEVSACVPVITGTPVSFAVLNTNDSGAGSFRQTIIDANAHPGPDSITFNIAGAGPFTIGLNSALPEITDPVQIDATTQPGSGGTPIVELSGAAAGLDVNGLFVTGGNSTVRGLVINGFSNNGIAISGGGGNVIAGNYIGLDVTGTVARPNTLGGIALSTSTGNTIGGVTAADRNVISGNGNVGVGLYPGGDGNFVRGNYIGTNAAGSAAVPNSAVGVLIDGCDNNVVGGTEAGARNVVSGNGTFGISAGFESSGTTVEGNYIGTNAAGSAAIPNASRGISISNTSGTRIRQNVIAGHATGTGVWIGSGTNGTTVRGNLVGTNAAGTAAVPNQYGVDVAPGAEGPEIGGLAPEDRNVISGNTNYGIGINPGVSGTLIRGNYVGTNAAGTMSIGNGRGIVAAGADSTIGGPVPAAHNVVSGNAGIGIELAGPGATGNTIQGNYVGVDATGAVALANGSDGIYIGPTVTGNTIGVGNVVSGNTGAGINARSTGTTIVGNRIGTNADGTAAVPNQIGVRVENAPNNVIGGPAGADRNLISGNSAWGVAVLGAASSSTIVRGNYIGTTVTGAAALRNVSYGLVVTGAPGAVVDRNVISGNGGSGYGGVLVGGGADGTTLTSNSIGTSADGSAVVSNGGIGVEVNGPATTNTLMRGNTFAGNTASGVEFTNGAHDNALYGNFIGTASIPNGQWGVRVAPASNNNAIGSGSDLDANHIVGNTLDGVRIEPGATGITVLGNNIWANGALGINQLNPDPPAPALTYAGSITVPSPNTTVTGVINLGTPSVPLRLEFFGNAACDGSGSGEGEQFLGYVNVTTNESGTAMFKASFAVAVPIGHVITASAITNVPGGGTSAFSVCYVVVGG